MYQNSSLTAHLMSILQAYNDGKVIECRDTPAFTQFARGRFSTSRTADWGTVGHNHRWNVARFEYRIKPFKPVTLKVYSAVDSRGNIHAVGAEEEVKQFAALQRPALSVVALTSPFLPSA